MVAMLLCMFFSNCQDEPLGVPDIDYSLPEITNIEGPGGPSTVGDTVTVSLTVKNGTSFSWSEENDAGTGWIVKLSKEITGGSNTPVSEYDCKLTFTLSTGQVIVKTVPKLIKIK